MATNDGMVDDWREQLGAKVDDFLLTRLGPDIAADMARMAPKDTGRMAASIRYEVADQELRITVGVPYAAAVENGHREVIFGRDTGRYVAPRPFMRPALYKRRRYPKR